MDKSIVSPFLTQGVHGLVLPMHRDSCSQRVHYTICIASSGMHRPGALFYSLAHNLAVV